MYSPIAPCPTSHMSFVSHMLFDKNVEIEILTNLSFSIKKDKKVRIYYF